MNDHATPGQDAPARQPCGDCCQCKPCQCTDCRCCGCKGCACPT